MPSAPTLSESPTSPARRSGARRWLLPLIGLAVVALGIRAATAPPPHAGNALAEFDPARLGAQEQEIWEAYYLKQWPRLFWVLLQVSREQFGLSPAQALYASYIGTLAQVDWKQNGASTGKAEAYMRDFYAYVKEPTGGRYDPAQAAEKEIRWWAVHRDAGHRTSESRALEDAFTDLYVELYQAPPAAVRPAAQARARAVDLSDQWLDAGMPPSSPLLARVRDELITSYTLLHTAVNQQSRSTSS